MPEMDGLQAIRAMKEKCADVLILIVSCYQQYTISAMELDVFRYLVKGQLEPSFDDYLEAALRRVDLKRHENYFILSARKQIKITCRDIIYCYKEAKMSVIVTKSEQIRERKPLQSLLGDLQTNCDYFAMIERGYIVNLYYVEKLEKNVIYLENNIRLPVGFTYGDEVKRQLNTFWRKRL